MRVCLVSVAVLVMLSGCPASSPSVSGPIDAAAFPAEAARANCALLFDCCTVSEVQGVFTGGSVNNEAECVAYFESLFASELTAARPRLDAGALRWNAEAAGACVAAIDDATCPDVTNIAHGVLAMPLSSSFGDGACTMRLSGTAANGGACGTDLDCGSGYCDTSSSTRVCAELPGAGAPCSSRCASGLGCDVRASAPSCVTRRPDGATCTSPGFGDVCESRNCAADSTCQPFAPTGRCTGTR